MNVWNANFEGQDRNKLWQQEKGGRLSLPVNSSSDIILKREDA